MSAYTCSAYKQCQECGDDSEKYIKFILYDCSQCGKKDRCESCIEWVYEDDKEQKPICAECYKSTSIRVCNDCHKRRRCEYYTCWKCHKTDICEDCITYYHYDDGEELCTVCSQAKEENEEKRKRARREEDEKNEARYRRDNPRLFPTFSEKVQAKQNEPK